MLILFKRVLSLIKYVSGFSCFIVFQFAHGLRYRNFDWQTYLKTAKIEHAASAIGAAEQLLLKKINIYDQKRISEKIIADFCLIFNSILRLFEFFRANHI